MIYHIIEHPANDKLQVDDIPYYRTSDLQLNSKFQVMGLLPDTQNRGLRMRRECRERFPRHRIQRKLLVSDPGMHHGTCVTHVPWCMSGSLNCGSDGKRSQDSRRMRNSQFYVSGKRPMPHISQSLTSKYANQPAPHFYHIWFKLCALHRLMVTHS